VIDIHSAKSVMPQALNTLIDEQRQSLGSKDGKSPSGQRKTSSRRGDMHGGFSSQNKGPDRLNAAVVYLTSNSSSDLADLEVSSILIHIISQNVAQMFVNFYANSFDIHKTCNRSELDMTLLD
jgi:hypothetical protein